jgi:hypothetical protein
MKSSASLAVAVSLSILASTREVQRRLRKGALNLAARVYLATIPEGMPMQRKKRGRQRRKLLLRMGAIEQTVPKKNSAPLVFC